MTTDETDERMRQAISAFNGPVKRCPSGKARGDRPVKAKEERPDLNAAGWQVPPPDEDEQRRRWRMAQMKRKRIAKHNAPIMRRMEKQERKTIRNMAIIKR